MDGWLATSSPPIRVFLHFCKIFSTLAGILRREWSSTAMFVVKLMAEGRTSQATFFKNIKTEFVTIEFMRSLRTDLSNVVKFNSIKWMKFWKLSFLSSTLSSLCSTSSQLEFIYWYMLKWYKIWLREKKSSVGDNILFFVLQENRNTGYHEM